MCVCVCVFVWFTGSLTHSPTNKVVVDWMTDASKANSIGKKGGVTLVDKKGVTAKNCGN